MKFLRTIRFDASDDHVYALAAAPNEWAVSGAFAFVGMAPDEVTGKTKQAFANGFLGLVSFGRATFASVHEIAPQEQAQIELDLAQHLLERYGAPSKEEALAAAREEIAFVSELCAESLVNTVFTVRRFFDAEGHIREEFRTIRPPEGQPLHTKIWSVVEDDG